MRVRNLGPAGLLFALRAKRCQPAWDVRVVEQAAPDATFGLGVVFSEGGLAFLDRDVPDLHRALADRMEARPMRRIVHRDQRVDIDGNGFASIARLDVLAAPVFGTWCQARVVRASPATN